MLSSAIVDCVMLIVASSVQMAPPPLYGPATFAALTRLPAMMELLTLTVMVLPLMQSAAIPPPMAMPGVPPNTAPADTSLSRIDTRLRDTAPLMLRTVAYNPPPVVANEPAYAVPVDAL